MTADLQAPDVAERRQLARRRGIDPVTPALAYLACLGTEKSRASARQSLARIARALGIDEWRAVPWGELRAEHTTVIFHAFQASAYGPGTVRFSLATLQGVLKQSYRLGFCSGDDWIRAKTLPDVKGASAPAGRSLSKEEIDRLGAYTRDELPGAYGVLVRAVLAVMLGGGLRRSEVAGLVLEDVSDDGGSLRVMGKGKRERIQKLPAWAAADVAAWVKERERLGLTVEALFVPISCTGRVIDQGMSETAVYRMVVNALAGSGCAKGSPHDLRRTFATNMMRKTDLLNVAKLMGHAFVSTTEKYDRRDKEEADAAVEQLEGWGDASKLPRVFTRGGDPLDVGWARGQIASMRRRHYSLEQVARALTRAGVTSAAGDPVTEGDVRAWEASFHEGNAAPPAR